MKNKLYLQEDVQEDVKVDVDDKTVEVDATNINSGIANVINNLIIDEFEAINGYNSAIATLVSIQEDSSIIASPIIAVLNDIINEENAHVGQLQKALELVSKSAEEIDKGASEGEEQIIGAEERDIETEVKAEEALVEEKIYSVYFGDDFLGHYSAENETEASAKAQAEHADVYAQFDSDSWVDLEDIILAKEDELHPLDEFEESVTEAYGDWKYKIDSKYRYELEDAETIEEQIGAVKNLIQEVAKIVAKLDEDAQDDFYELEDIEATLSVDDALDLDEDDLDIILDMLYDYCDEHRIFIEI